MTPLPYLPTVDERIRLALERTPPRPTAGRPRREIPVADADLLGWRRPGEGVRRYARRLTEALGVRVRYSWLRRKIDRIIAEGARGRVAS